ncbi:MAG: hypothetical protein AB8H79_15000 [Myxococcota bacterium]
MLAFALGAVLVAGALFGALFGPLVLSMTVDGSMVSEGVFSVGVAVASLFVSGPLCLFMLLSSAVWHRRVRQALEAVGVEGPAVGIWAPTRLVAGPIAIGFVLTLVLIAVPLSLPTPDAGDLLGSALWGVAWLTPALGLLVGLLIGWRRGFDGSASAAWGRGELTSERLASEPITAFPLIDRRPRALVCAELLRREGHLGEAERRVRAYAETVGVSPVRLLTTWARILRDLGRIPEAEQCLAQAARLVPFNTGALRELADLRRIQGKESDSLDIEATVEAIRGSSIGWLGRGSQRVQA